MYLKLKVPRGFSQRKKIKKIYEVLLKKSECRG